MIKLGSVSFMNAKPLTFAIEQGLVEHDFEIKLTPPSELSQLLAEKDIDVGLIPVAEFLRRSSYSAVPGISISSYGNVDSVVLLTKGPLTDVKKVAVDRRSQSSTALLRIILEIFHGLSPEYTPRATGGEFLKDVDAGMIIGDTGLETTYSPPAGYEVHDLGGIWTRETGLPFVYAVFAVNNGVELGPNLEALYRSKEYGLGITRNIAKLESLRTGIDEGVCYTYMTERIKYGLGEKEIEGISKYGEYLSRLDGAGEISRIKLYSQ
ncbi:MAG: menaquinone biosynthesis protein [Candidatus Dadabacteria bacterium]|nr:MAG: menaquinone biosynthesis protein [Candidatus Dadabacteria bacterium]